MHVQRCTPLRWDRHEACAAFASAPANPFTVRGAPIAENTLAVAAGLDVNLADRTTLTLGYSGEYATDAIDHGLAAKLRIQF